MDRIRALFLRRRPYTFINAYCHDNALMLRDMTESCKHINGDYCDLAPDERIAWAVNHGWKRGCDNG